MLTGNTGEWSEFYVLLRLISERKIFAANENVEKISNVFYPIDSIYRSESPNLNLDFCLTDTSKVEIFVNGLSKSKIPFSEFKKHADYLLEQLSPKSRTKKEASFSIEESQNFMYEINCRRLSAKSTEKSDIIMKIHDVRTGYEPICGFSIKSELGSPPTLINSSKATNFKFKVENISESETAIINSIETKTKIKDRMSVLFSSKHNIIFESTSNIIFDNNLIKLDTLMPQILANALVYFFRDGISNCKKIIEKLEHENPLNYPVAGIYEYKFKKFLCASALGMMPSKLWSGKDEASGGYIIVRSDGEVLAYNLYNRDAFEDYLLNQTKFEKGSISKHDYANVYFESNNYYINLNLSIRFIK